MQYSNNIKPLKLEAQRRYDEYQKEKIILDKMIRERLPGRDLQSIKTQEAERQWLDAHQSFIDALAKDK